VSRGARSLLYSDEKQNRYWEAVESINSTRTGLGFVLVGAFLLKNILAQKYQY
jgi:hypothetical protein